MFTVVSPIVTLRIQITVVNSWPKAIDQCCLMYSTFIIKWRGSQINKLCFIHEMRVQFRWTWAFHKKKQQPPKSSLCSAVQHQHQAALTDSDHRGKVRNIHKPVLSSLTPRHPAPTPSAFSYSIKTLLLSLLFPNFLNRFLKVVRPHRDHETLISLRSITRMK